MVCGEVLCDGWNVVKFYLEGCMWRYDMKCVERGLCDWWYVVRVLCDGWYVVRVLCQRSNVLRVLCDWWYVMKFL